MNLKRAIVILILGLALAVPSSALAGDSWVLWQKTTMPAVGDGKTPLNWNWEIIDGYAQIADCNTHKEKVCRDSLRAYEKANKRDYCPDSLVTDYSAKGAFIQFYCLPGTLDPREPK